MLFRSAASDTWPIDLRDLDDLLAQGYAHLFPQPGPVALVLERLAPSAAEPSATSVNTLRALLDAIATPPPGPGPGRSRAFDAMARAFRSNKYQRQWIFETLAVCGALPVRNRPSYWERYVPQDERPDPPERNNELKYPASFWTASDGVDAGRVNEVFGHLFERAWVAPG